MPLERLFPESASRETCQCKYYGRTGFSATGQGAYAPFWRLAHRMVWKGASMAGVTLYVCTTCSRSDPRYADTPRAGKILHDALAEAVLPDGVTLRGVECLSACSRSCSVALTAPGRWTYIYGDLDPDSHVDAILDGAARYAATQDGLVPWRERPEIFRKQSVARIPPQES